MYQTSLPFVHPMFWRAPIEHCSVPHNVCSSIINNPIKLRYADGNIFPTSCIQFSTLCGKMREKDLNELLNCMQ